MAAERAVWPLELMKKRGYAEKNYYLKAYLFYLRDFKKITGKKGLHGKKNI